MDREQRCVTNTNSLEKTDNCVQELVLVQCFWLADLQEEVINHKVKSVQD